MINLIGCLFITASTFDVTKHNGWITNGNFQDSESMTIYISAVYFAIVTCATVGYGDINPVNLYEVTLVCFILIFGVAYFSYILSDLSN
jgi:hypothetical protein